MNETPNNRAQQIWQSQPVEGTKMSVEAIRLRAGKFERKISRRNLRESIAALGVIIFFAYFIATTHDLLFRIAWAVFVAGMIWLIVQLQLRGAPNRMPAEIGASTCLEFFRSELVRQRDLVKDVWGWYLAPMVPGYLAYNVAHAWTFHRPISWAGLALFDVFSAALFIGVWKLNMHAARCLQRSIDELDAAKTSSAAERGESSC